MTGVEPVIVPGAQVRGSVASQALVREIKAAVVSELAAKEPSAQQSKSILSSIESRYPLIALSMPPVVLEVGAEAGRDFVTPNAVDIVVRPESPPEPVALAREPVTPEAQVCEAAPGFTLKPTAYRSQQTAGSFGPGSFGPALARAAISQTRDFVIYNDRYRAISYPGGDVSPLYGVCTDVVIRAYRALGIDLQQRVAQARIGSADTNINHRRTDVLRVFFARFGKSLPLSTYAEDYLPGDIVTYYRPQNRHSRSHIAVVSDVVAPSGRYMIVHNRGWGVQLEDGLFVDALTGHYRYEGSGQQMEAAASDQPSVFQNARVTRKTARRTAAKDGASVLGLGR